MAAAEIADLYLGKDALMVLRRSDERRRRVVMDEALQTPAIEDDSHGENRSDESPVKLKRPKQYSKLADRRNQPRPSDFIPTGRIPILWVVLLVSGLLSATIFLDGLAGGWKPILKKLDWAFDARNGALPAWLSSISFFAAALYCLVIFGIRQHRSNDYRGTYRIWRWLAGVCIFASSACIVNWPKLICESVRQISGLSVQPADWWILTVEVLALLFVSGRLALEVKSSRSALPCVGGLTGFALFAILGQSTVLESWLGSNAELVVGWAYCLTAAMCFLSVLFYGRFVTLHAAGLIFVPDRVRSKKKKKKKKRKEGSAKRKAALERKSRGEDVASDADDEESADEITSSNGHQRAEPSKPKSDQSSKPSQPPLFSKMQRTASSQSSATSAQSNRASTAPESNDDENDRDDLNANSRLSKADRKRLKREQRDNRRAA